MSSKALSAAFKDMGICHMRDRVATRKKEVAEEANNQLSTKNKEPKKTKKVEADANGRQLTKLLGRALKHCVEDASGMIDPTDAVFTALRPSALKLAKVYKPCAVQIKKTELTEGAGNTHGTLSLV